MINRIILVVTIIAMACTWVVFYHGDYAFAKTRFIIHFWTLMYLRECARPTVVYSSLAAHLDSVISGVSPTDTPFLRNANKGGAHD